MHLTPSRVSPPLPMMAGLAIFRLLVKVGPGGPAARRLQGTSRNTLWRFDLSRMQGWYRLGATSRYVIDAVDFTAMSTLLLFLTKGAAVAAPEICAPLAQTVNACCLPEKRRA